MKPNCIAATRIALLSSLGVFVLSLALPARADLLPDGPSSLRLLETDANGINDFVSTIGADPFDDSISSYFTEPGLLCPTLEWSADAAQTSSITATGIDAIGTASIATPPDECAQGSGALAASTATFRFVTDEIHELVLTGVSQNASVTLAEANAGGTVFFERLASDPGGAISFSQTLPPDGYELVIVAEVYDSDPFTAASFDVQLDALPAGPSVPVAGVASTALLAAGMAMTGVARLRRSLPGPSTRAPG